MPRLQILPLRQDQSLHRDPRDSGPGRDADGTSRFSLKGKKIHHYMAARPSPTTRCCPRSRWPKSVPTHRSTRSATIGCGVTTGIGAVINHRQGRAGANVVVVRPGRIGLNVLQGARMVGANMIVGVDLNRRARRSAASSA